MGDFGAYTTYLLRVQQTSAGEPPVPATLRLILEDVRTGERRGFDSLAELFAYLTATPPPDRH